LTINEVSVAPGAEARTMIRVRNNGSVVDQFDMQVLGPAAAWTTVEPASISLLPGAEQSVDVLFRPAKASDVLAGRTTFAVKAMSHEDPDASSVEEGVIDVLPYDERAAELIPRTSKGRRSATHEIAVDNRGNAPIVVDLTGVDPAGTMGIQFDPPQLTVAPGTAQFSKVRVQPAKSFWRGQNKTAPFTLFVTGQDQPPIPLDGSMLQIPILPKWFWKAVIVVLAVLLLLVILWFALVKPQIKSSAEEVIAPVEERLDAASIPTVPEGGAAEEPGAGAATTTTTSPATESSTNDTTSPTQTTVVQELGASSAYGDPFSVRLEVQTGTNPSASYSVPVGMTFAITDIVLQNPQGDSGRLTLLRDDDVLLELSLENFRLHDLHTISPYIIEGGENVILTITCTTPGPSASQCVDAASLAGFQQ